MSKSTRITARGVRAVKTPLRPMSPEEAESWSDGDSEATLSEPQPSDLDESWAYTFQVSRFHLSNLPSVILNIRFPAW